MRSRSLMIHDVRLMGQKEAALLEDFPALSNGMIVATLQIRGQFASYITTPLTIIINNFRQNKKFPDLWKIARISPIVIIRTPEQCSDDRPIYIDFASIVKKMRQIISETNCCIYWKLRITVLAKSVLACMRGRESSAVSVLTP